MAAGASGVRPASSGHVWRHFASPPLVDGAAEVPVMARGQGSWVFDSEGDRYFDALSALYCVNVGYGRSEIARAMAEQAERLCFFPIWASLTEPSLRLAERITSLAPPGFEYVFFTGGGSESIDSAWKLIRQYHQLVGTPGKVKIIAREGAYHGTSLGALSITGVQSLRDPFEPLLPGVRHAPKVDYFHADVPREQHTRESAEAIVAIIEEEGPDSVAAVFIEPIQNAGGCLVADPEYFTRVREICDEYDLLLVSDETICSWGRIGEYFGCQALEYQPDLITTAKGLTSAYAPMGAVVISERVAGPFSAQDAAFNHGLTFAGHPVACAAALATIDILENEQLCLRSRERGEFFRERLEELRDLPIVGDVRGMAMFQAIELVADQSTGQALSDDQRSELLRTVPREILQAGVICRALHRGAPVIQLAPPLIATEEELVLVVDTLRDVLTRALRVL